MSADPTEDEGGVAWGRATLLALGVLGGVALGHQARLVAARWRRGGMQSDLASRIISEARRLCTPTPPAKEVGPGDPRWDDEILGGRLVGGDGQVIPGKWLWYEDGKGTTCAVTATAVMERAGAGVWTSPTTGALGKLLLNRPEPVGAGYTIGAWQTRFLDGGERCGVLRRDADLVPGDLYCIVRDRNPAKWHVGIVLERDGSDLLTADGGQTGSPTPTAPHGAQCARLTRRTLRGRVLGSAVATPGEVAWRLTWP